MERENGGVGGSGRRQRPERSDDQAQTAPAVLNMGAEDVDGWSGAQNQGHRYLPTKAERSGQWRNAAPSPKELSRGKGLRRAMLPRLRLAAGKANSRCGGRLRVIALVQAPLA
jgi:hypothetical protein